jgi:hypothetical protein
MNNYVSQQDYNQNTTGALMKVMEQAGIFAYEATKWVASFIGTMVKMYLGK